MSKDELPQSQSISISSSQVSGQIGQAGQDLNQTQINQMDSKEWLTSTDVIQLLAQIEELIRISNLLETQKQTAIKYLDTAKEEVQHEEPDKNFAAKSLQRTVEIVKKANDTLESGQGLFEEMQSIVTRLLPWLGVAKSFFGF